MTLMYQLEVGTRITASPRTKDYGRISVISQLTTTPKILFKVPRTCFTPAPRVTSCIVSFSPLKEQANLPTPTQLEKIEAIVKQAFSERRKMLRSTLKPLFTTTEELHTTLQTLNIAPTSRAEELSPQDFLKLSLASTLKI